MAARKEGEERGREEARSYLYGEAQGGGNINMDTSISNARPFYTLWVLVVKWFNPVVPLAYWGSKDMSMPQQIPPGIAGIAPIAGNPQANYAYPAYPPYPQQPQGKFQKFADTE